jgi:hypothetical protein
MRFLFRLVVLALAAFGAKALYDKLAPHSDEFKRTGADLVDRTTSAAREVAGKAQESAQRVASTAQESASEVKDTAVQKAQEVRSAAEDAKDEARDAITSDATNGSPSSSASRPSSPASSA